MANLTRCTSCITGVSCTSCHRIQAYCSIGKQTASSVIGNFTGWDSVDLSTNGYFFTKSQWESIYSYIQRAYNLPHNPKSNPSFSSGNFLTAEMFNQVCEAMRSLGGYTTASTNKKGGYDGDIVYGNYFEIMKNDANNFKLNPNQCSKCNSRCDVPCNQGCQGYALYCCSCNTKQGK